jgi:hypothetical protein
MSNTWSIQLGQTEKLMFIQINAALYVRIALRRCCRGCWAVPRDGRQGAGDGQALYPRIRCQHSSGWNVSSFSKHARAGDCWLVDRPAAWVFRCDVHKRVAHDSAAMSSHSFSHFIQAVTLFVIFFVSPDSSVAL